MLHSVTRFCHRRIMNYALRHEVPESPAYSRTAEYGRSGHQHRGTALTTRPTVSGAIPPSTSILVFRPRLCTQPASFSIFGRQPSMKIARQIQVYGHHQHQVDRVEHVSK